MAIAMAMDGAAFWLFLVSITALTVSPGVDTVLVIRNASRGGVRDGIVTTLGICAGLFVHATVSAFGISAILLQSAFAFSVLKLAGAAYLVWLGITSLRQALTGAGALARTSADDSREFRLMRSAREGLLSNVLNPKPIVFYMAFLPQFIDPAGSALVQSLALALIHFVISVVWLCTIALAVERMRRWLSQSTVRRTLDGVVGGTLTGLGLGLAVEVVQDR